MTALANNNRRFICRTDWFWSLRLLIASYSPARNESMGSENGHGN